MMLIPTQARPSAIHGLGLFAVAPVPRGTPIWRFEPGFDREFTSAQFAALPPLAQQHLRWFAFREDANGHWVLGGDLSIFMNHAAQPNTGSPANVSGLVTTVALRDIAAGEELTCDYFAFDAAAREKLGELG
jgi:SET domain-containing protein